MYIDYIIDELYTFIENRRRIMTTITYLCEKAVLSTRESRFVL